MERFTLPTGETVWGKSDKMPYYDENGDVAGVIIVGQSITERKRAEEQLSEANAKWEWTFDAVPDLIAILDARLQDCSCQQSDGTGDWDYRPKNVWDGSVTKQSMEQKRPPSFCPHAQLLRDGQAHVAEVCEERLGGDFSVSTSPIFDSQGRMIGSVHVAHDITERKRSGRGL